MSNRENYPAIAAIVDEFRKYGLASGARFTLTEKGRTFSWIDAQQDVDAILKERGIKGTPSLNQRAYPRRAEEKGTDYRATTRKSGTG